MNVRLVVENKDLVEEYRALIAERAAARDLSDERILSRGAAPATQAPLLRSGGGM